MLAQTPVLAQTPEIVYGHELRKGNVKIRRCFVKAAKGRILPLDVAGKLRIMLPGNDGRGKGGRV